MIPFAPLTTAQPDFNDQGELRSTLYDDIYASADGALAQAAHVFVAGNDLPQRWDKDRSFVIVETGFGAGINFLVTWDAWRHHGSAGGRLHYISVEKHPFQPADLARVLRRWPQCAELSGLLLEQYPLPLSGFHRLHFDAGRVVLTLGFGDVADVLPELDARADAFFLDGFAPARNPQMWSDSMFAQIARLAAPGATAATYTAAASVRERLQRSGFAVRRATGFARKRDMLCARYERSNAPDLRRASPSKAIVVGAGLAGSACAARLAASGFDVEVIERHTASATEASGNPAGLVMPAFSLDWNVPTRLTVSAFLHARRRLMPLARTAWFPTGVLQLARDDAHLARHRQIIQRFCLPPELLHLVSEEEGSALAGQRVATAGWWLPSAGWAAPAQICRNDLAGVRVLFGRHAVQLRRGCDEQWEALDASEEVIARAPLVILANAHAAGQLLGDGSLPLVVTRGQVSFLAQPAGAVLHAPVCREGFITPAVGGLHCIGASYQVGVDDLNERIDDHRDNLERLRRVLPDYAANPDPSVLTGRVGLRAMAPDRMPVMGACSSPESLGLYACLGLASRGLTYAPLLAETLTCMINGEPLPIERGLAARMDPGRINRTLQT